MDTDNDGAVSLSEFQTAHERIFRSLDANKDGRLTMDELQSMMRGRADTAQPGGTPQERKTPE
jgi:Ca2+-binding EF-hand superfamily protein